MMLDVEFAAARKWGWIAMPNYYFSSMCKECKEPLTVYVVRLKQPASEEYFAFTCDNCQSENIGTGTTYSEVVEIPDDAVVGMPAN
jgi:hypothetical protein